VSAIAKKETIRAHLCEWASANLDGTWTIIRGGITHWDTPQLPINLGPAAGSLFLFVDVPGGLFAAGDQDIRVIFHLPGGIRLWERVGRVNIETPSAPTRVALPLDASIQAPGMCRVEVSTAGCTLDLPFDVRLRPAASP
jgi:hypothetical protein